MGRNFSQHKKRRLVFAILKSVLCGVSAGVFAAGAVLLVLKLCAVDFNILYYAVIGVAVALVCGGVCFIIVRPTEKNTAKKLDDDYRLGERVQTMVEFGGKEGALYELQREDAKTRLEAAGTKAVRYGTLRERIAAAISGCWQYVVLPIVACAIILTGILIPAREGFADNNEDDDFEITVWQIDAMEQLISDVNGSDLTDTIKNPSAVKLGELLDTLKATETASGMRTQVIDAVSAIDGYVASECSFIELSAAYAEYEKIDMFATAMVKGVEAYTGGVRTFTSYSQVENVAKTIDDVITERIRTAIEKVNAELCPEERLSVTELRSAIALYVTPMTSALESSALDETDALYSALLQYKDDLEYITTVTGASKESLADTIILNSDTFVNAATLAVHTQSYNEMMDDFIRDRLCYIFAVSEADLPEKPAGTLGKQDEQDVTDAPNEGNEGNEGGGAGDGDVLYGSDDEIFYYKTGEHVSYGSVLTEYDERKTDIVNDDGISEEMKRFFEDYFNILYGGFNTGNQN